MVSDFIYEKNGYLQLREEEYRDELKTKPNAKMVARKILQYGEAKEGYWTSDRFMHQIEKAYTCRIAEIKYPKADGWKHVRSLDHI